MTKKNVKIELSSHYEVELLKLKDTYKKALREDVTGVMDAIKGANNSSIIGVGSGGSFTVASLLCNLHEAYTGRVSRPSTPLEIICNPTLAASSPVFLISAEGHNPDISEALKRARLYSARTIHILTNKSTSRLTQTADELSNITSHVFELTEKDGYLATNSLLLDCVLVARAYAELDKVPNSMPSVFEELKLKDSSIKEWLDQSDWFFQKVSHQDSLIIIYSPSLRPIATDLESKLSESALLHTQLADMRSFAHGRHLWLEKRSDKTAILALVDPSLDKLWSNMQKIIPAKIPILNMCVCSSEPSGLIAGLVAEMGLVSIIGKHKQEDPGRPEVPKFGRDLYYLDIQPYIPQPDEHVTYAERAKYDVLGVNWPLISKAGHMTRSLESFKSKISKQKFRAIVFDYDGTLCPPHLKDQVPPKEIIDELLLLMNHGVVIAIASGRGGSMREMLRRGFPEDVWPKIHLGMYNGGLITTCSENDEENDDTSELLFHATRIMNHLRALGVPIGEVRRSSPYQVSVRFLEGVDTEQMWYVVGDALLQAGLSIHNMVRSKHSIDILATGVSKSSLVVSLIQQYKLLPEQVLTIGDQGAWPGNDASLLEHRYSLSVDIPSRRLERGWKLAPTHKRDVDATKYYLEKIQLIESGYFQIKLENNA